MGKTYRKVKGEKGKVKKDWRSNRRASSHPSSPIPHPSYTPEQAIDIVRKHVDMALEHLISANRILLDDKEDLQWQIYADVVAKMDEYDPMHVSKATGKYATFETYLKRMADYSLGHLMQDREDRAKSVQAEVPIADLPPAEARAYGYLSTEDAQFSSTCRSLRDMIFRMDLNTFIGMLTPRELLVLRLRLAGYSFRDMEPLVGIAHQNISDWTMDSIQHKADECGFEPPPGFVFKHPAKKKKAKQR